MKIRSGFVSNSSSSSFIVDKSKITAMQMEAIENHVDYAQKHYPFEFDTSSEDMWSVHHTEGYLSLYAFMDNFDMRGFLDLIGVPEDAIGMERGI